MKVKRSLFGALVVSALAASGVAVAGAAGNKVGKLEVYGDALAASKLEIHKEGLRQGKFDGFREGMYESGATIAASSLDNARSGDGTLYGYRV